APVSLPRGPLPLPASVYHPGFGVLLLLAAFQMMRSMRFAGLRDENAPHQPPFLASMLAGSVVGFVSGITGVGGGIFLAPLVLSFGSVGTRQASAVSAALNLL